MLPARAWGDQVSTHYLAEAQLLVQGVDLCQLLSPEDFALAGISGANKPVSNSMPSTDFYCLYAGLSSYKGGIELDAFLSQSKPEATQVFMTVTQEHLGRNPLDRARQLGVDQASMKLKAKGYSATFATIAVQSGRLVFVIGFPSNPQAEVQLMSLAEKVLQRARNLTKESRPRLNRT
ncbi:MAG: hypothetical protein WBN89_15060 [Prochlorococcaceae cyanobacterium]